MKNVEVCREESALLNTVNLQTSLTILGAFHAQFSSRHNDSHGSGQWACRSAQDFAQLTTPRSVRKFTAIHNCAEMVAPVTFCYSSAFKVWQFVDTSIIFWPFSHAPLFCRTFQDWHRKGEWWVQDQRHTMKSEFITVDSLLQSFLPDASTAAVSLALQRCETPLTALKNNLFVCGGFSGMCF